MLVGFEVFCFQDTTWCLSQLLFACKMYETQLPHQYHGCLHAAMSHHDDNGLTSENVSKPQFNVFFMRVAKVMVSPHSNKDPH